MIVVANVFIDTTSSNTAFPLTIDIYYEKLTLPGILHADNNTYNTPQDIDNKIYDLPDNFQGGFVRFNATDANGNTSEMSPPIQVGFVDLIFAVDFED